MKDMTSKSLFLSVSVSMVSPRFQFYWSETRRSIRDSGLLRPIPIESAPIPAKHRGSNINGKSTGRRPVLNRR